MLGVKKLEPFKAKKTKQGAGKNSRPKRGKKAYRGQGR
jgi:hypothetical protein